VLGDGSPLAGATVECFIQGKDLSTPPARATTTGVDGRYVLGPLLEGFYTIRARVPNENWIQGRVENILVENNLTTQVPPINLVEGGIVEGRVFNPGGKEPAAFAIMRCGGVSTAADTGGQFQLKGVPPGAQQLEANNYADSPASAVLSVEVVAGATVTVEVHLVSQ